MSLLIRLERLPWKGRPTGAARHYVCERNVSRVIPISFPSWASQGRVREKLEEWMPNFLDIGLALDMSGELAHSTCRCDNNPNCTLFFGGISDTPFESRAIVCAWSTRGGLWARDLVAHAMKGCSVKRKSTICAIQNSLGYVRTRMHAR